MIARAWRGVTEAANRTLDVTLLTGMFQVSGEIIIVGPMRQSRQ
jgi:hypothetical protein